MGIKILTFFKPSLLFQRSPRLLVTDIFSNPLTIPHLLSIRDLKIHALSAICDITDESNKLNKNLSVISFELVLSFLLCLFRYGDKLIHMIKVAYTNIESKIKINCLLSDSLILMLLRQGCLPSMLLYNIAAVVLANFINADKRIKGIQTGDHKIKIVKFTDNTTIFLRDITCFNRI